MALLGFTIWVWVRSLGLENGLGNTVSIPESPSRLAVQLGTVTDSGATEANGAGPDVGQGCSVERAEAGSGQSQVAQRGAKLFLHF